MNFTIKEKDSQNRELTLELGKEDLARYVRETEDSLGQDLALDGFRKGKAPRDAIIKHFGEPAIREAALQTAMQRSLSQVLAEQDLDVLEATDLAVKENSADKLIFTVNLKIFPVVKLPALDTIKIPRRKVEVETKEIDDTLESIRASRADVTDVDRPAATGDRVEVDFEVKENGKIIDGGASQNHPLVIGKNNFIPGFEDQLVGMKKGETKEFSLTAPIDFANKEVAGKKLDMKVTMQKIQSVKLPELNDEFAQKLGKFNNIDQLILNIKDGLLQEKEEKESQRARLEAIDKLIAGTKLDITDKMLEDQLDVMTHNFDHDLHRHGMELGLYLAKLGKTEKDLRKDWRDDARRQVAMSLVLHALARDNDIKISDEELNTALESLVHSTVQNSTEGLPPNLDVDALRRNLESRLLTEKTLQYLESKCVS